MPDPNDFYEDDEPVEKIRAAWKRGTKRTARPRDPNQRAADIVREATTPELTEPLFLTTVSNVVITGSTYYETPRPLRIPTNPTGIKIGV